MRNGTYSRNAVCPYYHGITITKGGQVIGIGCECIEANMGFDVLTLLRFKSKADMDDYFEIFCADRCDGCPYYQAIQHAKGGAH